MFNLIKGIVPKGLKQLIRYNLKIKDLYLASFYDIRRYSKYSATNKLDTKEKLRAEIIKIYHIIEKGLTMPQTRLGFGRDNVLLLSSLCLQFFNKYNADDAQVQHAIGILEEYYNFHLIKYFQLDSDINDCLLSILDVSKKYKISPSNQLKIDKNTYFEHVNSPFNEFAYSRKSVRNYSNKVISDDLLNEVLKLAQTTPSACNRQGTRLYIFRDKKRIQNILEVQNGNRGFGHLTNCLILLTVELGVFANAMERNQAFIDGGMYTMNLLYALHYNKLVACTLNCSNTPKTDKKLQEITGISSSEVFIAMVSCGFAVDNFEMANSPRYTNENIFFNKDK